MKVELVSIARDEGPFIREWLAHYLMLGFDRITVYDNASTDGMSEVLQKASAAFSRFSQLDGPAARMSRRNEQRMRTPSSIAMRIGLPSLISMSSWSSQITSRLFMTCCDWLRRTSELSGSIGLPLAQAAENRAHMAWCATPSEPEARGHGETTSTSKRLPDVIPSSQWVYTTAFFLTDAMHTPMGPI